MNVAWLIAALQAKTLVPQGTRQTTVDVKGCQRGRETVESYLANSDCQFRHVHRHYDP
jgi:ribosomal protein S11